MYFNTHVLGTYPLKFRSFNEDFLINYSLIDGSDRKQHSIDRGTQSDRYTTTLVFRGKTDYIKGLVEELTLLRTNQELIQMRDIPEPIFGEHIDHSLGIDCYVLTFGKESTPAFNIQQIEITFIVDTASLIFNPVSGVPSMECLRHKWEGFSTWNAHVQESYFRDINFIDREADIYVFKGEYILSVDDTSSLLNWWRTQRGNVYTLTESEWGVTDMFGPVGSSSTVEVIINSISTEYMSPNIRNVSIEIIRNGSQ